MQIQCGAIMTARRLGCDNAASAGLTWRDARGRTGELRSCAARCGVGGKIAHNSAGHPRNVDCRHAYCEGHDVVAVIIAGECLDVRRAAVAAHGETVVLVVVTEREMAPDGPPISRLRTSHKQAW